MFTMRNFNNNCFSVANAFIIVASVSVCAVDARQVTIPVVVDGVAGRNGSVWQTEVRILKLRLTEALQVRRAWVALPGGGFEDDPSTAPTWTSPAISEGYIIGPELILLVGSELFAGTGSKIGAVGLEIDGEADVNFRTVETGGRPRLPQSGQPYQLCCFPGTGSLLSGFGPPISGVSHLPWLTLGNAAIRTNVTLINPTVSPVELEMFVDSYTCYGIGIGYCNLDEATPYWAQGGYAAETLDPISVPPFGWMQLSDVYSYLSLACPIGCPLPADVAPGVGVIFPQVEGSYDPNGQYYAYATIIDDTTNSAMFEPAVPGFVE